MYLIGLTGGIASGKSTVSNFFRELGCPVIDADLIAREVVVPNRPSWKLIVKHFGSDILQEDGTIDRPKLGRIIFGNDDKRHLLNSCTHPYIQKEMMWRVFKYFLKGYPYIILDIPLLLEGSALRKFLRKVIVVYCDEETQLNRLMTRSHLSQEDALARISSQMPLCEKRKQADYIIDNSGSVADTKLAVDYLNRQFQTSYAHWKLRLILAAGSIGLTLAIYGLLKIVL
ncbi:dephospho-CoA kinase domain-containing protein-like [Acanthaster planci]|uniref:Dephospho-CoA kinase domain-containing protein n=1 Tax=Acanthaster planci TaxID=133434 RepID=A0A8B7XG69_ACAPL|nr:dephospho-CoA kinase domain-containing protein-like [Acanthaster planci]